MSRQEPDTKNAKIVPFKGRKCPMCGKPMEQAFRPFCSRRCANLDLGNWFGESYRVPVDETMDEAAELDDYGPDEE